MKPLIPKTYEQINILYNLRRLNIVNPIPEDLQEKIFDGFTSGALQSVRINNDAPIRLSYVDRSEEYGAASAIRDRTTYESITLSPASLHLGYTSAYLAAQRSSSDSDYGGSSSNNNNNNNNNNNH